MIPARNVPDGKRHSLACSPIVPPFRDAITSDSRLVRFATAGRGHIGQVVGLSYQAAEEQ